MPDWRRELAQRLAPLRLNPAREVSVITELTQHLDQHYEDLLAEGAADEEAYKAVLAGLDDGDVLRELRNQFRQPATLAAGEPGSRIDDGAGHSLCPSNAA